MDKFSILIVEDELLIAEDIRMHLENLGYLVTDMATSYNEAINSIMESLPDMVIVDINIDGQKDGIELGEFLTHEVDIPFIYLTGQADKGTIDKAKETKPGSYLIKPFTSEGLYAAVEMALSNANDARNVVKNEDDESEELVIKDSLFVKKQNHFVKVKIDSIKYISSDGNYLNIYKSQDEKYLIRSTIKKILPHLPNDLFFQTYKSHIVNLSFLDKVTTTHVVIDGKEIPLSKNKKEMLLSKMNTFS